MIKHWPKTYWGGKGLFDFPFPIPINPEGCQGRNSKQELKLQPGKSAVHRLAPHGLLTLFSFATQVYVPRGSTSSVSWVLQYNPLRKAMLDDFILTAFQGHPSYEWSPAQSCCIQFTSVATCTSIPIWNFTEMLSNRTSLCFHGGPLSSSCQMMENNILGKKADKALIFMSMDLLISLYILPYGAGRESVQFLRNTIYQTPMKNENMCAPDKAI